MQTEDTPCRLDDESGGIRVPAAAIAAAARSVCITGGATSR